MTSRPAKAGHRPAPPAGGCGTAPVAPRGPAAEPACGNEPLAEYSSPPCYAQDFPGYFGEDGATDEQPASTPPADPPAAASRSRPRRRSRQAD